LLLGSVVAQLVPFRLCQNAEKRRVTVSHPMAEGKTSDEDGDASQDGIEEIESPHRSNTHEVEERALYEVVSSNDFLIESYSVLL
jgi:hypothetical protein